MVSRFRSTVRLIAYLTLTPPVMVIQALLLYVKSPLGKQLPYWYHRQVCRIMGLKVARKGRPLRRGPVLFVSNHVSYLDIEVLGSLIKGSFVAKAEVRDWPFFSWLARLQRTVFVERSRQKTGDAREGMAQRLEAGDSLILFAESTTSDGNRVLPFKSALFSVAELTPGGKPLTVQPVSIAYTHLDGAPLGRFLRPYLAWYGDMALPGHLWNVLGLGRVTVTVEFHKAVTIADFGGRKALAAYCEAQVKRGVTSALTGRPIAALPPAEKSALIASP